MRKRGAKGGSAAAQRCGEGVVLAEQGCSRYWSVRVIMQGKASPGTYDAQVGIPPFPTEHQTDGRPGLHRCRERRSRADEGGREGGRKKQRSSARHVESEVHGAIASWAAAAGALGCRWCRRRRVPCCSTRIL